jgi:hypothetical protein
MTSTCRPARRSDRFVPARVGEARRRRTRAGLRRFAVLVGAGDDAPCFRPSTLAGGLFAPAAQAAQVAEQSGIFEAADPDAQRLEPLSGTGLMAAERRADELPGTLDGDALAPRRLQHGQQPADLVGDPSRRSQVDRLLPAVFTVGESIIRPEAFALVRPPRGHNRTLPGQQLAAGLHLRGEACEAVAVVLVPWCGLLARS